MDHFVCLRMIQMNGVDLAQFQFDFDMSFGVLFMNPDGTIYGRYGSRDSRPPEADSEISMEGLRAALEAALSLHKGYPANRSSLEGKKESQTTYAKAELYPKLSHYTPLINYQNNVAKSCIHCHQIHDAERQMLRDAGKPIPDEILYLYPMPQVVGITLDSRKRATIERVAPQSAAAAAKLKPGDQLQYADGQALISIADFQWVLHNTPGGGATIPLTVLRSGKTGEVELTLPDGWRKKTDFSWRVSTWDLRRIALGGMSLETGRSASPDQLGLEIKGAGKYGNHAVARRAGVRPGDELIEIAGLNTRSTEAEVIAHILNSTRKGDSVTLTLKRGGKEMTLSYKTQ
jgi:predicted metalloprotease with PDZ domain